MAEVAVPDFVNGISEEFGSRSFGSFVGCKILDENGMLGFGVGTDNGSGVVWHNGICWWAWRYWEWVSPRRCVGRGGFDQSDEIVRSRLIIGEEERYKISRMAVKSSSVGWQTIG
jgi:hypothetical protein